MLRTATAEAFVAVFPCVAFGTVIVLLFAAAMEVRPAMVTCVAEFLVKVTPTAVKRVALVPAKVKFAEVKGVINVPVPIVKITEVVVGAVTKEAVVRLAAFATGSGPSNPNESDPTRTSSTEILLLLGDEILEIREKAVLVRFALKDILGKTTELFFDALSAAFRARIKDITCE